MFHDLNKMSSFFIEHTVYITKKIKIIKKLFNHFFFLSVGYLSFETKPFFSFFFIKNENFKEEQLDLILLSVDINYLIYRNKLLNLL